MRLTTVLLIASLMQVSAAGMAQKVSLNLRNAHLKTVIRQLESQTGYDFVYRESLLNSAKPVSINVTASELTDVLDQVFENQSLTFDINEKTIVIKPKELSVLDRFRAYFKSFDAHGRVVDEHGLSLVGATVKIKEGRASVLTDAYGFFNLKNIPERAQIQISYIGYKPVEIEAKEDIGIIQLALSDNKLDEVQVQAYGKTSRRLNTGNIVTITSADIEKQPVNNPLLALQGRVPNLVISPASGLPGAKITLQVRGQNSVGMVNDRFGGLLNLQSEPLIVIDGVPYQNNLEMGTSFKPAFGNVGSSFSALSMLNPSDIEQIDVLADGDATSIYGSRGGNGVLLITTKKGKVQDLRVSAAVNTGFSQVTRNIDLMNTQQYLQMRHVAYQADLPVPERNSAIKDETNFDLTVWDPNRYTDWQKEMLGRNAPATNANISLNGGSGNMRYFISTNYNEQHYVFPGENPNRSGAGTMSLSGSSQDQKFVAGVSASYNFNMAKTASMDLTRLSMLLPPNAPDVYNADGTLNWEPNPSSPSGAASWSNPLSQLLNTSTTNNGALRTTVTTSYRIVEHLSLHLDAGFSQTRSNTNSLFPIAASDPATLSTGTHLLLNLTVNSLTLDPHAVYKVSLAQGTLELLAGASMQQQSQSSDFTNASGYTSDALLGSLNAGLNFFAGSASSHYSYLAGFGRLNYNWRDKYIVNISGRRDGSSRFGPRHRYGNFYSTSGAWIFSNEKFMKKVPWLSFGKLRGSFGTSGNDAISDYGYLEYYQNYEASLLPMTYQGISLIQSRGPVNQDYHWESIKKLEAAMDLGLFKDRILLLVAYWRTRASDQLGAMDLPATAGVPSIVTNQNAKIQNAGWDFTLTSNHIKTKGFNWSTSLNFGILSNKLLYAPQDEANPFGFNRFIQPGKPFSGFVAVYENQGVNSTTGLYQFTDVDGSVNKEGMHDFKKIDTKPITLGALNNLRYKAFELSVFVQLTRQMGKNYLLDGVFTANAGSFLSRVADRLILGNQPVAMLDAWKRPGDFSNYQRLTTSYSDELYRTQALRAAQSDMAWVDASFIRLKNAYLSYQLPLRWIQKTHLKNGKIYLQAQNLFTITGYKGLDPEVQSLSVLPQLRTLMAGIQFEL